MICNCVLQVSGSSCPEAATCLLAAVGAGGLAALIPAAMQADQVQLRSCLVLLSPCSASSWCDA